MTTSTGRTNRLARESSPYLQLHANNPVDWYPWGEEALARARSEDKPIFLSVGYSTCYWCHVMERESFSDPAIAERMNRDFVCIKVDREERPDLDDIYMAATQVLAEQGGWPNSVFLTPGLEPFFAGTYFPPADAHGRPGFPTVLHSLAHAWRERRREVEEQAGEVMRAIRSYLEGVASRGGELAADDPALSALAGLRRRFDATWGGFGGAPKFPTPANLLLLLELAPERPEADLMLGATLDAMGRGGICDQLGGGFHRYSVDREWRVPHFEKMLYDNALLLEIYARDFRRTGLAERARVARECAGFLLRELAAPEGGFWSALDAETDGREGAFYAWRRADLEAALGLEDATFAAPLLGFEGEPFFEHDAYVLHLPKPVDVAARERRMESRELLAELAGPRARLLAARAARPRPATDDKVLADWNGLTIAGLAVAGRVLDEPAWIDRAAHAAEFVLAAMRPAGGPLLHVWRAGEARLPAYLGDYAGMLRGLLALAEVTGAPQWIRAARDLAGEMVARLRAPDGGFFNAAAGDDLLVRPRDVFDGAIPAANALAALALLELAERTGEERWRVEAESTVRAFGALLGRQAESVRTLALAAHRLVTRGRGRDALAALVAEARRAATPHLELAPAGADGYRSFRLTIALGAGWHLAVPGETGPEAATAGLGSRLDASQAELRQVRWPAAAEVGGPEPPAPDPALPGTVEIAGEVRPQSAEARLVLRLQLCDDHRCLPPVDFDLPLG